MGFRRLKLKKVVNKHGKNEVVGKIEDFHTWFVDFNSFLDREDNVMDAHDSTLDYFPNRPVQANSPERNLCLAVLRAAICELDGPNGIEALKWFTEEEPYDKGYMHYLYSFPQICLLFGFDKTAMTNIAQQIHAGTYKVPRRMSIARI